MKSSLLLIGLTWACGAIPLFAKSELETLRNLCAEQERQIHQLEDDNAKLRSLNTLSTARNNDKPDPATAAPTSAPTPAATSKADKAAKADKVDKTYPVKDGETFTSIGKKFGISTATLIAANPNVKPSAMRPGQVIHLTMPAQTTGISAKPPTAEDKAPANTAEALKPATRQAVTAVKVTPANEKSQPPTPKATPVPVLTPRPLAKPLAATANATAPTPPTPKATPAPVLAPKPLANPLAANATPPTPTGVAKKADDSPPATPAAAQANVRSVPINGNTTYGEFAAKHGTTVSRLNELNALDLVATAPLAKGSELNVPTKP
ncbi:MAG: LysM peptidoglycan-binding domain-containing protein [Verrucomicrobiota bacterium]